MADLNLGTYSSEDVSIVISVRGASHIVSGYADGSFVSVEKAAEASRPYQGADNSGGRVFDSNKSGTITLTLHQLSSTNDFLTQIYKNDSEARDNTWLFNMLVKDNTGRSFYNASQCYIMNLPSSEYSKDVSERQWGIGAFNLEQHLGGNALIDSATVQAIESIGGSIDDKWKV